VAILLVVSLISLGVRTGLVVSLCIPLVFAGVFVVMRVMGIDLHTVSLGTLIIALGLLVDDEIIAVEMMSVKLEEGLTRFEAACSAYRITAMPMLSGTLITCAGFIPIGFARGETAEFTAAMFPVLAASLLISWLVSVTAAPFLGYVLIRSGSGAHDTPRSIRGDSLGKRFLAAFRCFLVVALRHRNTVIAATAVCFVLSVLGMAYVRAEFFPPSRRGEVIVDLTLPAGSSLQSIREAADKFSRVLDREEGILHYSGHIGEGAPRFVSAYAPTEPATNFAQFIVLAESAEARRSLEIRLRKKLNLDFPELKSVIRVLNMGPPSPYPVMLRVSGPRPDELRKIASQIAGLLRSDDTYVNVGFDWGERARTVRLVINPERLAVLGATRQSVAQSLHVAATGFRVGELYQGDRNLEIVFRLGEKHITLDELENIPVSLASGGSVPLAQLARLEYASEEVSTWRRDLEPCITVHAEIVGGTSSDATQKAYTLAAPIWESLPPGYDVRIGGDLENSQNSSRYLLEPIPLMLFAIFTLLMLQLKRFSLAILALSSAPLGLIGISAALLITDMPMGFVAQIGIIALIGMLIRNAVILLDQIDRHIKEGQSAWEAVINSAALRFRPIMLTALTAVLAMIPLMLNNFWGPLAVSLSGGLMVGTALTLIVLPCLYAAWFRVREFE
jgi:multidrug efflux pump subunit AcrB